MLTDMNVARWQRITDIVNDALNLPEPEQLAYARAQCADDAALLAEVSQWLRGAGDTVGFLAVPVAIDGRTLGLFAEDIAERVGAALATDCDWINRRLGAYRIIEAIARGGMGSVFKAVRDDDEYKKQVAIKLIRSDVAKDVVAQRFRAERQILANLEHPNIAHLIDGGRSEDGTPYLVMEYVEGLPIDQYCDAHALPVIERLKLFRDVCSAVHFAHQRLIVHRDLKPSNILVDVMGQVKLLDFGIAKLLDHSIVDGNGQAIANPTVANAMTPAYASPEQIKGEPITTASDVYALGVLLYRLLTGKSPYKNDTTKPIELAKEIVDTDPELPSTVVARPDSSRPTERSIDTQQVICTLDTKRLRCQLRGDLDNIVLMALRKDPQRRYTSAEQMAEDVGRCNNNLPVIARADTFAYRTKKFVSRNRWGVGFAVIGIACLIGGIIATTYQTNIARDALAKAEVERTRAQRHFDIARKFSTSTFESVTEELRAINGTKPLQRKLMAKAVEQLEELKKNAGDDPTFLADLGRGYSKLAITQGDFGDVPQKQVAANYAQAEALLARAHQLAPRDPDTVAALLSNASNAATNLIGTSEVASTNSVAKQKMFDAIALARQLEANGSTNSRFRFEFASIVMDAGSVSSLVCPREECLTLLYEAKQRLLELLEETDQTKSREVIRFKLAQTYLHLAFRLNDSVDRTDRIAAGPFMDEAINAFGDLVRSVPERQGYAQAYAFALLGRAKYLRDMGQDRGAAEMVATARALQERQVRANPGDNSALAIVYLLDVVEAEIDLALGELVETRRLLDQSERLWKRLADAGMQHPSFTAARAWGVAVRASLDQTEAERIETSLSKRKALYARAIDGHERAATAIEKMLGEFDVYEADKPERIRAQATKCREALARLK